MIVLRVSTEGALPSGFPDVFWGLGRILPNKQREGTAGAVPSRFASVYKHLPCLPGVIYKKLKAAWSQLLGAQRPSTTAAANAGLRLSASASMLQIMICRDKNYRPI